MPGGAWAQQQPEALEGGALAKATGEKKNKKTTDGRTAEASRSARCGLGRDKKVRSLSPAAGGVYGVREAVESQVTDGLRLSLPVGRCLV